MVEATDLFIVGFLAAIVGFVIGNVAGNAESLDVCEQCCADAGVWDAGIP